MTVGLSSANLANRVLDHLAGNASWAQPAGLYVALHTGEPGADGTANGAGTSVRSAATFSSAVAGAIALTGTLPSWSMTAGETISHISVWDASTAGNFLWSATLSVAKSVDAGDTLTLNSCGLSLGALAS